MISGDDLPDWARTLATLALGAGGAKLLAVWLENRRLSRKDYRETLQVQLQAQTERIEDLERQVSGLFERVGNLRVEVAHLEEALEDEQARSDQLEEENSRLRARLEEVDRDGHPDAGG